MNTFGGSSSSSPSAASPTTFVQADTNSFRDLVQKLTGLPSTPSPAKVLRPVITHHHHPTKLSSKLTHPLNPTGPRRSTFKLQERRQSMRKLEIKLGLTSLHAHLVDSPVLPSPVTPLASGSLFFSVSPGSTESSSPSSPVVSDEEKAIAEKGFFLHPSPRRSQPPELLPLFPLSSLRYDY
ncbi:hypothetical protein Tsubulata_037532 [Turnera subulata]|uniref:VQ domain-containing protein n=1 Tax=Turnera subulata TaxID=218843 RepID=A0A9Q0FMM4_9ROSI|nr:hypothetical protein Tsubulata_037532 [Turnera subulata]